MEGKEKEGSEEGKRTEAEWGLTRVLRPDVVFVGTMGGVAWAMAGRSDMAVVSGPPHILPDLGWI